MSRRTVLIGLLAAIGLGVLIERLIVTDTEALEAWAEAAGEALETGDKPRLTQLLAPTFEMGPRDRAATVAYAARAQRDRGVTSVRVTLLALKIEGDTATANGHLEANAAGRRFALETQLTFARLPEGWVLASAEPVEPPGR